MRKILFRGKRIDNGNWIEGSFIVGKADDEKSLLYLIAPLSSSAFDIEQVNFETVGQYTGLIDKNGTKIFEGDVLKGVMWWCDTPKNGVVIFKDGAFGFIWHRGKTEMFHAFTSVCNIEYEIIGNIHDNFELLGDE